MFVDIYLHVYLYSTCVQRPWGLDEGLNLLEVELQMIVSHPVGAGNCAKVLWNSIQWPLLASLKVYISEITLFFLS